MTQPIGSESFPYFGDEHTMLRRTYPSLHRRSRAAAGDPGKSRATCRAQILTEMGALGLLGMRYAPEYGGAGLDTSANAVLAEELGRSTYGGFAVTVLVHTDMASPHLYHAGSKAQLERWMRGHHRRPHDHRGRHDGGRRRLGPGLHAQQLPARSQAATSSTARKCSLPTACTPIWCSLLPRPASQDASARSRCLRWRKVRPASASRGRSKNKAGCRAIPPNWCLRIASCRTRISWARRVRASTNWSRTCRTNASCLPPRPWARP